MGEDDPGREILKLHNVPRRMFPRSPHLNIKAELARVIESSSQERESDLARLNALAQILPLSKGFQQTGTQSWTLPTSLLAVIDVFGYHSDLNVTTLLELYIITMFIG
jgi:hypothetical protein